MAHFAKISEENVVLTVLYIEDKYILDENNQESEHTGQLYLKKHNNWPAHLWIKTSYNTSAGKHLNQDKSESADQSKAFRGHYAAAGMNWYPEHDAFLTVKPVTSWTYDSSSVDWVSPKGNAPSLTEEQLDATVTNGDPLYRYDWNEGTQTWDLITL